MTRYVIDLLVGAVGLRTYDPLIKSQLLYHLSYAPIDRRARQKRPASWDRPLTRSPRALSMDPHILARACSEESPASRST